MHGNGNIPIQNNHVRSFVTALTRRMNSQYNRGLRTELFVLLRTPLVWKFYTYLNESALLTTQKLRESVSQFGEYKLCNDIPEERRAETPQYSVTDIERTRNRLLLSFLLWFAISIARRRHTKAFRSNLNCCYELHGVESSLKTSGCSASQETSSPFMEQHLLDITSIQTKQS
jgi:hypothetical protein